MNEAILKEATERVKAKDFDKAVTLLKPLVAKHETQGPALYVMGYCHEKRGHLSLARYLYVQALSANPNQAVVLRRLEKFDKRFADRKVEVDAEDFEDENHRSCWSCELRYRDDEPECTFCGAPIDEPEERMRDEVLEDAAAIAHKATAGAAKLGKELFEKVAKWIDPEDLEKAKAKVIEIGHKGAEKAKALADMEEVQLAAKRARELGDEAMTKAQGLVEREREKYAKADEQGRQALMLKWGLIVAAMIVLYALLGPGGCLS